MKNEQKQHLLRCIIKIPRLFIASIFVLIVCGISLNANAQDNKSDILIELNLVNVPIKRVFSEIEKQSNWRFFYNTELLNTKKPISINIKSMDIEKIVQSCIYGLDLEYEIKPGNTIIIRKFRKNISSKQKTNFTIKGKVLDKTTGEPLVGATLIAKENDNNVNGTSTSVNGTFEIIIHKNVTNILVSFMGYVSKEIAIKKQKEITIYLNKDVQSMGDAVVTGYFNKPKSTFTGAVTQITRQEIQKFGKANIINILSQVDPTFKIKENNEMGSNPNQLPDFFIRGEGSFLGGSNIPTFIVDGYEVSLQYVFDMDIDRIESLSILKDASATIHYGSRAANGVVVIETRRPKSGELRVNYINRTGLSVPDLSDYNLMNAKEKLEFERLAGVYTSDDPKKQHRLNKVYNEIATDIAKGVDTYWLSQPLRNALSHSHSIYISGGDKKVTYGLSANYDDKAGVMKKSNRYTYGVAFDLTYRVKDKINIRNNLSYRTTKSKNSPYGRFSNYASANPYSPIDVKNFDQHETYRHYNYLYNAKLAHRDENNIGTVVNNTSLDLWITDKLRLKSSFSLSKSLGSGEFYESPLSSLYTGKSADKRGYVRVSNNKSFSYDFSSTLTYTLSHKKHVLYSGIGINIQDREENSNTYSVSGFLDERFNDIRFALRFAEGSKPTSTDGISRLVGFMGNANYSYDNRYFTDLSIRMDGSSKYGANDKFGSFWSLGVGWNIHKEAFMQDFDWLEELKLRGSMGVTGNQNFDPTMAKTIFQYYIPDFYYQSLGAYFSQYGNVNLKWQRGVKRNIGLDLRFMNRRLSFSFDYYNDKTQGLLLPVTVAPSLGFSSYTENYGEQINNGYEFRLNMVILRDKDFDLAFYVSGTHNKNKIVKISNVLAKLNKDNNSDENLFTKPISLYEEGESLTTLKVVRSMGIDPETGKELYLTKDGKITDVWNYKDKVKVGDTSPKIIGNFGTNFIWRNLSFSMNFRYSIGSQLYNNTLASRVEGVEPHINADIRVLEERWKKPGDITFYKNIADRSVSNASSRFVQDNNYLELSNASIFYRFDKRLIKKLGFSDLRVGFNMNDLFYISTIKRERGLYYPYARQFTFTLNLNI